MKQKWLLLIGAILTSSILGVAAPQSGFATTITVNTTADDSSDNGNCTLREAIIAANTNIPRDKCPAGQAIPAIDDIQFTASATPQINLLTAPYELEITEGVNIVGPGADKLAIAGQGQNAITLARVFKISSSSQVTLSGLTIRDGVASQDLDLLTGGGGGGILIKGKSNVRIFSSVIRENGAVFTLYGGGGILILGQSTVLIDSSTVSGNFAAGVFNPFQFGGAGAIENLGDLTIRNSTITGNFAGEGSQSAGGIEVGPNASLDMENSTIDTNEGINGGGILFLTTPLISLQQTQGVLNNVTISGNYALVSGGGITLLAPSEVPPPLPPYGSTLLMNNVTIANNQAESGGGIYVQGFESFNKIIIQNSILGDNSATTNGPDCYGDLTSNDYNLIEDTTDCNISGNTGNNLTGVDPVLSPLGNYGGPTQTLALQLTSPALDIGSNDPTIPCSPIDQRGVTRPQDGDLNGTFRCDMGAFELARVTVIPSSSAIQENSSNVTVSFTRNGPDCSGTLNLNLVTVAGTATKDIDYILPASCDSIAFADGECGTKTCILTVLNDCEVEGTETVVLNYTVGGTQIQQTLTINDENPDTDSDKIEDGASCDLCVGVPGGLDQDGDGFGDVCKPVPPPPPPALTGSGVNGGCSLNRVQTIQNFGALFFLVAPLALFLARKRA